MLRLLHLPVVNVLFNVIHVIRVHITVSTFFAHLAEDFNRILDEGGACGTLHFTGDALSRLVNLPDQAPGNRWEAQQKVADFLMNESPILPDAKHRELLPFTRRTILIHGFVLLFSRQKHLWYSKKSVDTKKYGHIPLLIRLAALLQDPSLLVQVIPVCVGW